MDRDAAASLLGQLEPIVRRAGDHLLASFGALSEGDVDRKGVIDLVTRLDVEAQGIVQQGLSEAFPGDAVLAEESDAAKGARAGVVWLVDPLDGTTNFVHGVPMFAVSVARVRDGRVEAGMIYAPYMSELFWTAAGQGAYLNDQPLRVSGRTDLGDALLATGFPYDIRSNAHNNLKEWAHFAVRCRGLRRCGSAALDLAYVAAGRFDGFWEFRLNPWDIAAGLLMVQEANGRVSDARGRPECLWDGDVVAANGILHETIVRELARARLE